MIGHLVFFAILVGFSFLLTRVMIRVNISDIPNYRSAHHLPTPKSGGLAIAAAFAAGLAALSGQAPMLALSAAQWNSLFAITALVLSFALIDDLRSLSPQTKLLLQLLSGIWFTVSVATFETLPLPILGDVPLGYMALPISVLWIAAFMNIINFMDGLNGMASGGALIGTFAFGLFALNSGAATVYLCCFCLIAGVLGFFVLNFPRGHIFMGETGSQFLGFTLAAMTLIAAHDGFGALNPLLMPAIFFTFLFDVSATALHRLGRGHSLFKAHREHIYQLLHRLGWPQFGVSLAYFATFAVNIGAAVILQTQGAESGPLVFPALGALYAIPALCVWRAATRRGLLKARHARPMVRS